MLLVGLVRVIPVCIRAEEHMMASEFGAEFEVYQSRVGRLLPRLR